MDKRLKDPIYGYIEIPVEYMTNVIDTAVFQRLRRILQTSYAPLYSSAVHNRFVHSIGVFHLGRIVVKQLKKEILEKGFLPQEKVSNYSQIYQLACLLHDVGHAPFSHTGEGFYKTATYSSGELHRELLELVGSKDLKKDIPIEESRAAAPHEIMSCIVGIKEFGSLLQDCASREFFARCITGYRYLEENKENDIKNCFISMLNSKVIDVDRLDYLIRDAYITGFETVNIDYVRLLGALTIVCHDGRYQIAYRKDALSIIENVVYAHDAEKKWIQNHPVVLYESYLIQHIVKHLSENLDEEKKKLFSMEALSREGVEFKNGIKVSLLCDDDIIYLFKNVFQDETSMEYFERENRRHPVWKSEAEYNAFINEMSKSGIIKERILGCLKSFVGGNQEDMQAPVIINEKLVHKLEEELKISENMFATTEDKMSKKSIKEQQKGTRSKLNLCKYLVEYAKQNNFKDDFIIIKANMFNSNFSKDEITKMLIVFSQEDEEIVKTLSDVCKTLKAESIDEEFYYLYYRENDGNKIEAKEEFCHDLYYAVVSGG